MRSLALLLPLLAACAGEVSPLMKPGQDCASCHSTLVDTHWTVAGTVYRSGSAPAEQGVKGVTVVVVDSTGRQLEMVSNEAGNFYTAEALQFPLTTARLQQGQRVRAMPLHVLDGSCNSCHSDKPKGGAGGRLFLEVP